MSMKTKNVMITMGVLSVLLLTVVGITNRSTKIVIEKTIAEHQLQFVTDRVEATEIWLAQQSRILNATADSISFGQLGKNKETLALLQMAMKSGHFSDVYIGLAADGRPIDGAGWIPPASFDTRQRPWYKDAVAAGKTSFTTPYMDIVTKELVMSLASPLWKDNKLIGVIAADTVLDSLIDTLFSHKVGETGYVFVVNGEGTILIHPERDYVMKAKLQNIAPALSDITTQFQTLSSGSVNYLHQEQESLLSFKQVKGTDWFLCASIPTAEAYTLSRKTNLLFATEIVLKILGVVAILTLIGVSSSGFALFVSSRRFKSTIQQQVEEISGISEDLRWNISKRQEVETRYQTLFNVANDAILISKGMEIVECNDKASELFGGDRYSLVGRNKIELFSDIQPGGGNSKEKAKNIIEQAAQGEQQYYNWTFHRLDGSEFPAEVSLKFLKFNSEKLVLTSIRDISKRVFAEKQLLQSQKMAAMGEMLGAISHQWRQPLNILSTYIASLQAAHFNRSIDKPFVDTLVINANTQIQFMSKTIDDFRNFFKPSKNKRPFDVVESIYSAIKLMESQFKQREINISINVNSQAKKLIGYGYKGEFIHVLMNILANSKDAIEERLQLERIQVEGEISIDINSSDNQIILKIRDNGCGIPEHMLTKVFSPYFTTKGNQSGTGIGLYMSKIIVENQMKGTLTAENTSDGALLTVVLAQEVAKGATDA